MAPASSERYSGNRRTKPLWTSDGPNMTLPHRSELYVPTIGQPPRLGATLSRRPNFEGVLRFGLGLELLQGDKLESRRRRGIRFSTSITGHHL